MTKYQYRGRDVGADEAIDEDGILRDGFAVRVSLMDAMTPLQRAVAQNAARLHDGAGNTPGHRPGFVMSDDAAMRDAREEARDAYERELTNAWRAGDARKKVTQRDPQGRLLSTYEEENDDDVRDALPVRDGNMTLDAIEARHAQRMADEYRRYDARVREMWRNL